MQKITSELLQVTVISFLGAAIAYFIRYKNIFKNQRLDTEKKEERELYLYLSIFCILYGIIFLIVAVIIEFYN